MKRVDLNVDIGEGFSSDRDLLQFATSANVCCGEHAGNWELTLQTIDICRDGGVRIGAHPGFPDRESMGRHIPRKIPETWLESLTEQVARFRTVLEPAYIKPHGAWYNLIASAPQTVDSHCQAVASGVLLNLVRTTGLPAMILPVGETYFALRSNPGKVIAEGFADRGYRPNGALIDRSEPGAILSDSDKIQRQVLDLAATVDSICLHGDTPNCIEFAEMVKRTLVDAGFEVGF